MNPKGVLVIGLDGGTLDVIGPLAERGVMPEFRDLIERGRSGNLTSTVPWYTIPGWASLMTGVHPGTHGLLYWVADDPADYFENRREGRRFLTSADIPVPTFWDVAGAARKRVAIVNMPITYPAWPVNGTMLTGLLTPAAARRGVSFPEDLVDRFPGYRVDLSTSREADSPDASSRVLADHEIAPYLRELIALTEGRRRSADALLQESVDLGVVVFVGPDRISHKAWAEQERVVAGDGSGEIAELVEEYYRTLDRAVGALVATAGSDATILVVADHGFGRPAERSFGVNGWLADNGYLRLRAPGIQRAASAHPRLRRMVAPVARWWKRRRAVPGAPLVEWSRTTAYALPYPHTRVFGIVVNREGVKREGCVSEEAAPRVIEALRRDLTQVEDERGRRVVRRIHTREELGASSPGFPDLMVETEPGFVPRDGLRPGAVFRASVTPRSGLHEPEGILVMAGPGVRGAGPASADIVDVAPTVLALLGIAPPDYMEGKPLEHLIAFPDREAPPTIATGPSGNHVRVSDEEQREIEAHLRTLGYVE